MMLGPLAVDVVRDEVAGLLLAGDAAGFIDPMTGDGLRFAIRGGSWPRPRRSRRSRMDGAACTRGSAPRGSGSSHRSGASTGRCARWCRRRPACGAASAGARFAPGIVRKLIVQAGDAQAAS